MVTTAVTASRLAGRWMVGQRCRAGHRCH